MFWILGSTLLFLMLLGVVSVQVSRRITGGVSMSEAITVSDSNSININPTVIAAQPGVLTTRTNNTAGSLTMTNTGHGISTGQRVDLYWSGGQCYGAVVGTVSGTTVPIASVSGGDVLPSATTAIKVGIATSSPFSLTGNNLSGLFCSPGATDAYFVFNDGGADDLAIYLPAGYVYDWEDTNGVTNPLAGTTPTLVYVSHDTTTGSVTTLQAAALFH